MKRLYFIWLTLPLLFAGCDNMEDTLPDQQAKIASYLSGQHVPALISEQEKEASQDQNLEFYTATGETSYRYIKHYYDAERQQYPEVAYGDKVTITFSMYLFDYKNIVTTGTTLTMPYYSNNVLLEPILVEAGLTPGEWDFQPLEIELGTTEILKGLEYALPGCRERDSVEVFMTYKMAYGKGPLGIIPQQSPIAVFFTVDEVTKN